MLHNIEQLAGYFAASHVVLVENDSEDQTREVFNEWAGRFCRRPAVPPPLGDQQSVGVTSETVASAASSTSINSPLQAAGEPHQRRPPSHRTVASADGINLTPSQAGDLHQRPPSHHSSHAHTAQLISFTASDSYFSKKDLRLMASARNMYLELLGLPQYAVVDYLIAVDTDMCHPWDQGRIIKVWRERRAQGRGGEVEGGGSG